MGDRDGRAAPLLTRRALGAKLAGAVVAGGVGGGAAQAAVSAPDLDLRDAALRGLALAGHRGDPVAAAAARAALQRLGETDPEAAILARLYHLLDVRPAAYWQEGISNEPSARPEDLAVLHEAIRACRPVAFDYTDRGGTVTARRARPLALVHPAQGIKLLAWCETRAGFRQFFVRAMAGLRVQPGDFTADRHALLQGLLAKEEGGPLQLGTRAEGQEGRMSERTGEGR
ncbi:helix-turn-helix transcriptional regulator [Rhodobacter maris]|uniref:WYL domain-containing protein n=1 Tax=Rhodobacter maris TaxID=446682 RepID=A0A285TCN6_9RHOB|nr:WYL domain-containing protein [Rhodobacter maris]SOC19782.1 WYL domain-containing protein [Rhodobacter maris]